jgi:hypothetical protein
MIELRPLIEVLPNGRTQDLCVGPMLDRRPPILELALAGTNMVRAPPGSMTAGHTSVVTTITEAVPVMDLWHFHHCHGRSSLHASRWLFRADQHLREQFSEEPLLVPCGPLTGHQPGRSLARHANHCIPTSQTRRGRQNRCISDPLKPLIHQLTLGGGKPVGIRHLAPTLKPLVMAWTLVRRFQACDALRVYPIYNYAFAVGSAAAPSWSTLPESTSRAR